MTAVNADGFRARRTTWMLGGILLIAVGAFWLADASLPPSAAANWASLLLQAAALILFAIGLRRGASVTARRPLGTTALVALGVLAVALPLLLTLGMPVWSGGARTDADGAVTAIGTVTLAGQVIALMFAIIAVSQIWRAGVVPAPWRWAPLWALVAVVLSRLVYFSPVTSGLPLDTLQVLVPVVSLLEPVAMIFLGVVAVVLATRREAVEVYAG